MIAKQSPHDHTPAAAAAAAAQPRFYYELVIECDPSMLEALDFRLHARGALGTAMRDPEAYDRLLDQADRTIFLDPQDRHGFGDRGLIKAWFALSQGPEVAGERPAEEQDVRVLIHEPYLPFEEVEIGSWDPSKEDEGEGGHAPEQGFSLAEALELLRRDAEEIAEIFSFEGQAAPSLQGRLIEAKDWEEAWKAYFKSFRISPHVWIHPSWIEPPAEGADEVSIMLDAGSAFGTGTHASTQLCARFLDAFFTSGAYPGAPSETEAAPLEILDLGCGSGILAMIAAKLSPAERKDQILAIDLDPVAAATARENVLDNDLPEIRVEAGVLEDYPGPYDLLISNLTLALHEELLREYEDAVKPGGYLICSGITDEGAPKWRERVQDSAFEIVAEEAHEAWAGFLLRRKG